MAQSDVRISRYHHLAVAAGLALAGHLINWLPIPLGYGLDLLPGLVFAYIALLLLGPAWALFVVAVSVIPSYWHWGVPWPAMVISLEVLIVGLLARRYPAIPLAFWVAIFWVVMGTPTWLVLNTLLIQLDLISIALIVIKQAINGMLAASIAALLVFASGSGTHMVDRQARTAVYSMHHVLINVLVILFVIPITLLALLQGHHLRKTVQETLYQNLAHGLDMLEHHAQTAAQRGISDLHLQVTSMSNPDLSSLNPDPARARGAPSAQTLLCPADDGSGAARPPSSQQASDTALEQAICNWAHEKPTGVRLHIADPDADARLIVWRTLDIKTDGQRIAFTHATPAEFFRRNIVAPPVKDNTELALRKHDGTSVYLVGNNGATEVPDSGDSSLWSRIVTHQEPVYQWPDDRPSESAMHQWSGLTLWLARPSTAIPGSLLTATLTPAADVASYRDSLLTQLTILMAILAAGFALILGITRAFRQEIQPHIDAVLGLDGNQVIPGIPSRFMETHLLNQYLRRMSRKIQRTTQRSQRDARRLVRLVRNAPVIIWAGRFGSERTIDLTFVSPSARRLTGHSDFPDTDSWLEMVHPGDQAAARAMIGRLYNEGYASCEYRLGDPTGHYTWVYEEASRLDDLEDGEDEVIGLTVDISRIKATQEQLVRNAKMATLGEMATGMAHELNQPLQVIQLASDNARESLSPEMPAETVDYVHARLDRIAQQAERAAAIINDMRVFGRSQKSEARQVAIDSVVDHVLSLIGQQIKARGIEIVVDHQQPRGIVDAKRTDLEQTLANLLTNARDAIDARQQHRRDDELGFFEGVIRIRTCIDDERRTTTLEVEDNGGGIPEEHLEHVFEPFYTTKGETHATGLGLTLAFGVVHDLGGQMDLRNTDQGVRITVALPCHSIANDGDPNTGDPEQAGTP
ncbi:ATP-binding protein [Thioalkalivibrio sp. ALE17]|uniref:ATP-binding protein n=1 Tax=Thioalkalivibrio sp. ALE17 TaxID=1158173 RepID=UPI00048EC391|nr:ATP-binding protein [Thioalkalivibrio sp. ALE17]